MTTITEHKGIAYFSDFGQARDFGYYFGRGYPAWRVVYYERGYAVQVRPGGDYFGLNGEPSDNEPSNQSLPQVSHG